jgi:hypothetical protein
MPILAVHQLQYLKILIDQSPQKAVKPERELIAGRDHRARKARETYRHRAVSVFGKEMSCVDCGPGCRSSPPGS